MAQSGNVTDRADQADSSGQAAHAGRATQAAPTGKSAHVTGQASVRALVQSGWAWLAGSRDSSRLEAELLLAHALRQPRSYLLAHDDEVPGAPAVACYLALLERCAQGEPLAYLTGEREFWSLPLHVTPDVLIPRPETELAVERCLALRDASPATVADLGTGSGAIALALASERPQWRILATDREAAALKVAAANAARLGVSNVEFALGDWFAPLRGCHFDLIVSNPPYVAASDPALDLLRHEPESALSPGASGLEALRQLVLQAPAQLLPGGWLVLEHGAGQADAVSASLVDAGFARVRCHTDLAGHDRVTEAQWP
jgi:release factor glutamine methyltransferase